MIKTAINYLNGKYRKFLLVKQQKKELSILNQDISYLKLTTRSFKTLKANEINTISDLIIYTPSELLKIQSLGIKSLADIKVCLKQNNLKLKE